MTKMDSLAIPKKQVRAASQKPAPVATSKVSAARTTRATSQQKPAPAQPSPQRTTTLGSTRHQGFILSYHNKSLNSARQPQDDRLAYHQEALSRNSPTTPPVRHFSTCPR
ncbi:hypothetical protein CC86DRAFT_371789 [Ophiobolus disseminans]|uniref:Uncharacterized protein n=1 Tax=Ophiobolus disseminans TaxID=1469910 RepID=A0A6A6ZTT6_9PLEO|nr:hypothetical protein CC86DRAFT_371789 [Ophiobolus disseminans]